MEARVVNERFDYGEGYSETRFGFVIGDRLWMVGIDGYGHSEEESRKNRKLCEEIVRRWNVGESKEGK